MKSAAWFVAGAFTASIVWLSYLVSVSDRLAVHAAQLRLLRRGIGPVTPNCHPTWLQTCSIVRCPSRRFLERDRHALSRKVSWPEAHIRSFRPLEQGIECSGYGQAAI